MLRRGAKGKAVSALQRNLSALGYPLQADGVFGAATATALRRFQADHGLVADGIVGPLTSAAMREAPASRAGAPGLWAMLWATLAAWLEKLLARP